jgi:lipopolysaccharide/colanic/teichoic acid biosynthesis glycosyltransferase
MKETPGQPAAAAWSCAHDPRVTRLGHVLRRFRLDEIPQLWNVFLGEMSLVGPRPEQPELADRLEAMIPFYRERENMLPGLSGWAQVQYAYTDNIEDAATKLEYDLYYIKNVSIRLDVQIILRTFRIILFGMERKKGGGVIGDR